MKMIKAQSPPTEQDVDKAKSYKQIIYEAFKKAVAEGVPKQYAGVLVDSWLGTDILADANSNGYVTCTPLEKSGQNEFDFDMPDYKKQIEELNPTYAKVLVRYNPEDDNEMNKRQAARLAELSTFLEGKENKYLFELLVPATETQLEKAGSKENFDKNLRADLMVAAIKELQGAGVNPDVWKLEGLDTTEDMQKVSTQVTSFNSDAGIIILGRGESAEKAAHWLTVGAKVKGAVGFAVGRTIFKEPLELHDSGSLSRDEAIDKIKENYAHFVKVWEENSS